MSKWVEATIGEIAANTRNALVGGPFGSNLVSADYTEDGVPVIRGQNMGSRWVSGEFAYVSPDKARTLQANLARPGDIVFTQRGTLGQVALVPDGSFSSYVISQSQMKLTVDRAKADPLFLFYVFSSPEQQEYIRQNAIQVGVPHTNLGILRDTPVILPTLNDQRAIAHILGTLDDKIELNRRMNETLEAMARAIFKSWFVDFDPVRAKASREPPESTCRRLGLTLELLALFPDNFQDSELGEIPKGWSATTLGEHIVIHDSRRIPLSSREREARQGPFPYYGAAALMDHVDAYLFEGVHILMGEDGSVANADGTPVTQYVWGQFWVNNHAHVLTAKSPMSNEHLLLALNDLNIAPFVTGAVQAKLSQGNLRRIPIIVPALQLMAAFGERVASLFAAIRNHEEQTTTLIELRDSLLPKLLTGELSAEVGVGT